MVFIPYYMARDLLCGQLTEYIHSEYATSQWNTEIMQIWLDLIVTQWPSSMQGCKRKEPFSCSVFPNTSAVPCACSSKPFDTFLNNGFAFLLVASLSSLYSFISKYLTGYSILRHNYADELAAVFLASASESMEVSLNKWNTNVSSNSNPISDGGNYFHTISTSIFALLGGGAQTLLATIAKTQ